MENASKTVVRSYFQEETKDLIHDLDALTAWQSKAAELGLEGQMKLVSGDKSPVPFMYLNKGMRNVFATLCPRKIDAKSYDKSPIPTEVIGLIGLAMQEGYFDLIQVWSDDTEPDPVVIGIRGVNWYTNVNGKWTVFGSRAECIEKGDKDYKPYLSEGSGDHYLIARWADMDLTMQQLRELAIKRFAETQKVEIEKKIRDAQRELADLDEKIYDQFR